MSFCLSSLFFFHQPGWPTRWWSISPFIPDKIANTCLDCSSQKRGECRRHQQSPIDLWRNYTARRDCKDRHRMIFQKGDCAFEDMRFEILPHVLRANQPRAPCTHPPNIDFSWGFPHPWLLAYTDISVPSNHRQDGRRYDGEIVLSHTYSKDEADKRVSQGSNGSTLLLHGTNFFFNFYPLRLATWQSSYRKVPKMTATTFWTCTFNVGVKNINASWTSATLANAEPHQKILRLKRRSSTFPTSRGNFIRMIGKCPVICPIPPRL